MPGKVDSSFAVVIPVGPGDAEPGRLVDLVDALIHFEPTIPHIILIDDHCRVPPASNLKTPASVRVHTVRNTRGNRGVGPTSGLATGMMLALVYANAACPSEFIVKLDTDALVIGAFAESLAALFAAGPDVGMAGLYDTNCDGTPRDSTRFAKMAGKLSSPIAFWRSPASPGHYLTSSCFGRGRVIRNQIRQAVAKGYRLGEFVLGGSYAFRRGNSAHAVRRIV